VKLWPDACHEAGFTLLEALVALAMIGVVLSTVYDVIGSGLRTAHRDEDRLLLGLVAQNLLVRSRLDLDPAGGALSGDIDGGLRWRIESEPYVVPKDILPEAPPAGDKPLLPPREEVAEKPGTDRAAFGSRAAMADEPSSLGRAADEGSIGTSADGGSDRADEATEPPKARKPLGLRLIRVVVEKGDQRFELSTLAMESSGGQSDAR
jgi:prepilin-type N-terminal cleavage/methylation domain-containing protein